MTQTDRLLRLHAVRGLLQPNRRRSFNPSTLHIVQMRIREPVTMAPLALERRLRQIRFAVIPGRAQEECLIPRR